MFLKTKAERKMRNLTNQSYMSVVKPTRKNIQNRSWRHQDDKQNNRRKKLRKFKDFFCNWTKNLGTLGNLWLFCSKLLHKQISQERVSSDKNSDKGLTEYSTSVWVWSEIVSKSDSTCPRLFQVSSFESSHNLLCNGASLWYCCLAGSVDGTLVKDCQRSPIFIGGRTVPGRQKWDLVYMMAVQICIDRTPCVFWPNNIKTARPTTAKAHSICYVICTVFLKFCFS